MKKLILSMFLLGGVISVQAQTNLAGTAATSQSMASMSSTEMTRQMYNDLQLNEGQYIKLKSLNQSKLDRFNEINRMYSNDQQMLKAKMSELNNQLDVEFAEILSPEQFTHYLEQEGRAKNKERSNLKNPKS